MSISSVGSSYVQLAQPQQIQPQQGVEGSRPDGDGDQDDLNSTNIVPQNAKTASVTGNLGRNIDVSA